MCPPESKTPQAASRAGSPDAELVQRALRDPTEFADLYERYADQLYRYILQRVDGPETADDLVSETMISALESLDHYDSQRGTFTAWLFTIATRRVADHH